MGTLSEDDLLRRMRCSDALIIVTTGRNLQRRRRAIVSDGRLAGLVERGTMAGERVTRLADGNETDCPHLATVLVHGKGPRRDSIE